MIATMGKSPLLLFEFKIDIFSMLYITFGYMKNFVLAAIMSLMFVMLCAVAQAKENTNIHEKIQTSITESELVNLLQRTHHIVFNTKISNNKLAMAWAQVALENGRGKFVYNNNIGNVGTFTNNQFFYKVNKHRYRSFETLDEGAIAYWRVIKRCYTANILFDSTDVFAAAKALKNCKYYEADYNHYSNSMNKLYKHALKLIQNAKNNTVQK